jgi:ArsR family metal-binding transcriptional regulator
MIRLLIPAILAALPAAAQDMAARLNDYPTAARADYVFACMETNGRTRLILQKCSCSIDVIASILPYDRYVEAETVLSMQLATGEQMSIFRSSNMTQTMVADLRRAQAEAEMLCF